MEHLLQINQQISMMEQSHRARGSCIKNSNRISAMALLAWNPRDISRFIAHIGWSSRGIVLTRTTTRRNKEFRAVRYWVPSSQPPCWEKNMPENKWSSYEISGIRARKRGQERSRKTEVRRTKKRQEEFNLDEFLGTYYPRRGLEAHGTSLGVVPNVSRRHDGTRGSHVDFLPVANSVLDVERVATTRIGPIARFHGPFRVTAGA